MGDSKGKIALEWSLGVTKNYLSVPYHWFPKSLELYWTLTDNRSFDVFMMMIVTLSRVISKKGVAAHTITYVLHNFDTHWASK